VYASTSLSQLPFVLRQAYPKPSFVLSLSQDKREKKSAPVAFPMTACTARLQGETAVRSDEAALGRR
jgi:hypothetical protein